MKNLVIKTISIMTLVFGLFSCSNDGNNDEIQKYPTMYEIVSADANFSILKLAIEKTSPSGDSNSILNRLRGVGSFTVFAPTNAAFIAAGFPEATVQALNPTSTVAADVAAISALRRVLQYHILSIGTLSNDLLAAEYSKTFASGVVTSATNGTLSLFVNQNGMDVLVNGGAANNGAKVITANVNASNGVIHVIDGVLKLPTIVDFVKCNPKLSTLLSIVTSTSTGAYGDQSTVLTAISVPATTTPANARTLYAPTNTAFATATTGAGFLTSTAVTPANVTKVLQYHVESANRLTVTAGTSFSSSDVTVSTLLTPQTFLLPKNLLLIREMSTTTAASNLLNFNIQATNGVIHTVNRVLQPTL